MGSCATNSLEKEDSWLSAPVKASSVETEGRSKPVLWAPVITQDASRANQCGWRASSATSQTSGHRLSSQAAGSLNGITGATELSQKDYTYPDYGTSGDVSSDRFGARVKTNKSAWFYYLITVCLFYLSTFSQHC